MMIVLPLLIVLSATEATSNNVVWPDFNIYNASTSSNVVWPDFNIYNASSCSIKYPFSNETHFCASAGRVRARVRRSSEDVGGVSCVDIEWRRRDRDVNSIGVYVTDERGVFMNSTVLSNSTSIVGTVCFETSSSNEYYVYYQPYGWSFDGGSGSYHSHFLERDATVPLLEQVPSSAKHSSDFVEFQYYSDFDAVSPMEIIASASEIESLRESYPSDDILTWVMSVYNASEQSVRMFDQLPYILAVQNKPNASVVVSPNQYVVQVVLYASNVNVTSLSTSIDTPEILSCIQSEGVDYLGHPMSPPPIVIPTGTVSVLHFLVNRTRSISQKNVVIVKLDANNGKFEKKISIEILPDVLSSNTPSFDDVWRLSRLGWLNSLSGIDSSITRPYVVIYHKKINARMDTRF